MQSSKTLTELAQIVSDNTPAITTDAALTAVESGLTDATPEAAAIIRKAAKRATTKAKAKPVASADNAAAERAEITAETQTLLRHFYTGASAAIHSSKPCKRSDYASRVLTPVQRIGNNGPTDRDNSALAMLLSDANGKTFAFHPERCGATGADLGCVSRLASGGFITYDAATDTFSVTKSGATRARALLKRIA